MGFDTYDEKRLLNFLIEIADENGTDPVPIVTTDLPGLRFDAFTAGSDDSIGHTLEVAVSAGGPLHYLGSVQVPAGAGQAGVPAVDVLAALQVGEPGALLLSGGIVLLARVTVAMSSGKRLYLYTVGGQF
jgi:hypothetical protein